MIGECLESITFERTQRAIRRIVEICPRKCWVLRDGKEVRVLTGEVQVGERVIVKPGARIPVDGVVTEGRSAVDASTLTGESLPADKGPGDAVYAGTLNQFGSLTIDARKVAEHTISAQVIELTRAALKDKATVERTADRLTRYFLPAVLGLAALTFAGALFLNLGYGRGIRRGFSEAVSLSVDPTLAVLVVACPCALILATPAAVLTALGRLAGTGVLVKGGSVLERLANVTAFAFDKTGTLTEGKLELGEIISFSGKSDEELIRLAATAEQRSEHVIARLIVQEANRRHLSLDPIHGFRAHPGSGVSSQTDQGTILVGTRGLLKDQGIDLPAEAQESIHRLDQLGQTALFVARDNLLLGVIGARDRVRPEARGVVRELRRLGIQDIAMLSGDRKAPAQAIGQDLDISEIHAELLPDQKAEFVKSWQQGRRVAMVGDGINDSPALALADVGLAIGGTGSDIAAEAGDVVMMGNPLRPLPLLLGVSREMVRVIRQNIIIFAFGVNGLGIVLTAWLWPITFNSTEWSEQGPLAAAIYHQLGSLAVLLNSMRLLWFRRTVSHPSWGAISHSLQKIDIWLNHHLDPGEWLHWASHHVRAAGVIATIVAMAVIAFSGITQIGPDEIGVVRRFGRPVVPDWGPGLHWHWPWPVEKVTRIQPGHVRIVEIGFRSRLAGRGPTDLAWSKLHGEEGIEVRPEEAVMITGDGNLVELQASFQYTISDPQAFLLDIEYPDDLIRSAGIGILSETVAGRRFSELLTRDRELLQKEVLERLKDRLNEYGNFGIHFEGMSLHDLHPPFEVVPDYHRVTMAMEGRDRQINEAEAERLRVYSDSRMSGKRAAQVRQNQILSSAAADKQEKIHGAEAARSAFQARLDARAALPAREEWHLLQDSLTGILNGQDFTSAIQDYDSRRNQRIKELNALTDFRLFWEAMGLALSGREKVLVDAEHTPGRRQLLMFDPEQLRVPSPVLAPSDRNSMRK
jgi:Cu+-exporting ATPase